VKVDRKFPKKPEPPNVGTEVEPVELGKANGVAVLKSRLPMLLLNDRSGCALLSVRLVEPGTGVPKDKGRAPWLRSKATKVLPTLRVEVGAVKVRAV